MSTVTTNEMEVWSKEIDTYIEEEKGLMLTPAYRKLANVTKNSDLYNSDKTISGFSPMEEVGEGGNALSDAPLDGYEARYYLKEFRKSVTFTSTMRETSRHGEVMEQSKSFATAPEYTRNLEVMGILRNGWDTTITYGDSKQVISLSHARKDGGTAQGNTFDDGVQRPLSYDAVKRLEDVMGYTVSNSGNILETGAEDRKKILVTTFNNRLEAFKIADVASGMEPDTAENNQNYFVKGANFDVLITKALSHNAAFLMGETSVARTSTSNYYDSMWFIVDPELAKKYFKVMEMPGYPETRTEIQVLNGNLIKVIDDKYKKGMSHWMWVYGSKGDNTTFAS